ncbi:pancreatic lipase-related protein 2 isoform X3 [Rhipicephalus microplus]|uniref:pancreatic lipase-related protein 2 isoform X3 n=1 Tax=Rhipicephalus microplus TaxID=6941 RepID=UPI003F6B1CFC
MLNLSSPESRNANMTLLVLLCTAVAYGASTRNAGNFNVTTPATTDGDVDGRLKLPGKATRFIGASVELLDSVLPGNLADAINVTDTSNDSVCYPLVGCFRTRDPLTVPTSFPDSPEKLNTSFLLYSRQNRNSSLRLDYRSRASIERLNLFRERKPLKLIVHGWHESGDSEWVLEAKDLLLNIEDCNVVVVDWRGGSQSSNYIRSAGNTALVGREGSLLLQQLLSVYQRTLSPDDVHVIGHSLGGQVSGFLGRHFFNQTGVLLGRITELYCDHKLSKDFFLESLRSQRCRFISEPCGGGLDALLADRCTRRGDRGEMGYFADRAPGRGVQTLETNDKAPYCRERHVPRNPARDDTPRNTARGDTPRRDRIRQRG